MFKDFFKHLTEIFFELFKKEEVWIFVLITGVLVAIPFLSIKALPEYVLQFIRYTWWFWLFFVLFSWFRALILYWREERFKAEETKEGKYVLLELRIPRELQKGAKSMEQVFVSMHQLGNSPGSFHEKYLDGEVPLWFSVELVSLGGEIHFYVRIPKKHKNLLEAAFFSHYSDVEITEAEDYVKWLPATTAEMYAQEQDMWGTEMKLANDAAFPIKTYAAFDTGDEERQVDPISTFLEVLGKLRREEVACVQILISPAGKDWKEKWAGVVEKLRTPELYDTGDEEAKKIVIDRTAGQTEKLDAVQSKLSKPAFNTVIRLFYVAPKTIFKDGSGFARGGIIGAFNQYSSPDLNGFKQNSPMGTRVDPWQWPYTIAIKRRTEYRKQRLLYTFRKRIWPPESFTGKLFTSFFFNSNFNTRSFEMTVDELATVFHPPTAFVLTAPHLRRVESKKTGPPAGLQIFGEESQLERFENKE